MRLVMGWLFRLLFKYPPVVFEQGNFTLAVARSTMLAVVVAAAIAIGVLLT